MDRFKRQALYSWAFIAALASLSVLLAVLQYSWIGEVSHAEQDRLKSNLTTVLERLRVEFNSNISQASTAVTLPPRGDLPPAAQDRDALYVERFKRWRDTGHQERLFGSITRVVPQNGPQAGAAIALRQLDQQRLQFRTVEWPANWGPLRDEFERQTADDDSPRRPPRTEGVDAIVIPLFDGGRESRPGTPLEWVVLELDLNYLRTALMPEFMEKLARAAGTGFDAELVSRNDAQAVLFQSDPDANVRIGASADAQVVLLDVRPRPGPPPRDGGGGPGFGGDRDRDREQQPPPGPGFRQPNGDPMRGRWLLSVRHQTGSLDALVTRTRRRNIAVTTAVLALMLVTITALVRFTRRAQTLSRLQMQFVAGVSHELRTPLTVIRTAAHNLSSGIVKSGDTDQMKRYGRLITSQTDKLTALVEQVLGFANAESGRVISKREPIRVESLIEGVLADCQTAITEARCDIEKSVEREVAPLFGDPNALRHALQNLVINAAKYGADGHWIGIFAGMTNGAKNRPMVEIRVADRGAGIPDDERAQIFEPFYRGRRAIDDQIHGTGLGLALVKRIVEAHGGTIEVRLDPQSRGTEFVLRIPPAPPEQVDEFADIVS